MPIRRTAAKKRENADFASDTRGGVAFIFALLLPILAVSTVAAIQLSYIVGVRSAAQDAADQAALQGAQQLHIDPVGASSRAQALAMAQLASRQPTHFTVLARLIDAKSMQVIIDSYTPSFFGDQLPAGGFRTHVVSVAQQQSQSPLCVLIDGPGADDLTLTGSSQIGGSCLVHSDDTIMVAPASRIMAARIETVGSASGPMSPLAQTGGMREPDPFQELDLSFPSPCSPTGNYVNPTSPVSPGIHNDIFRIADNQAVVFSPGVHYLCGSLIAGTNSTITGNDVTLVFDKNATVTLNPNASVALRGSFGGRLAGFAIAIARNNTNKFNLSVDQFSNITGVIYSPAAKLVLTGTGRGAQASDWTVVAARSMEVDGSANLQINTNYMGSRTPVPVHVGNRTGDTVSLMH